MMQTLHVVIPVFNGWLQTRRCLDALRNSRYPALRILVVDHGSTDNTAAALACDYPEVQRIVGDASLWWSGATNLGIRAAIADGANTVMLLNNDCYLQPGSVQSMLAHLQKNRRAIIAPMQLDALSEKIVSVGSWALIYLGFPNLPLRNPNSAQTGLRRIFLIAGGRGALIPVEVFREVGLLDEIELPHYYADHDFYLRCRKHGIALYVDTEAVVKVDSTKTSVATRLETMDFRSFLASLRDRRSHRNLRDLSAFFKKHYPVPGLHYLAVILNFARYFATYAMRRFLHLILSVVVRRNSER